MIKLGVVAGDGVGPEVIAEGLAVLAAVARIEGISFETIPFDLGGERYLKTKEVLPDAEIERLRGCDAILLGAVGHPDVPPGILEKGILLRLRFDFHQYINLRPVQLYTGVECPIRGKGPTTSTWSSSAKTTKTSTSAPADSLARARPRKWRSRRRSTLAQASSAPFDSRSSWPAAAPRWAHSAALPADDRRQGFKRQVTLVAKTNVLTFAHDLWMRTFTEVSRDYPEIKSDYQHVDACCMRMVTNPERFDVIVTTNMFGDIITDLGAVLQGGHGPGGVRQPEPRTDRAQHVRAGPRLGARHRRQRDRQSAGGDLVGRHDARPP